MRILIGLTRGDTIGGAQKHVLALSQMLNENGFEVLVVCGGYGKELQTYLDHSSVKLITLPEFSNKFNPFYDIYSLIKFYKIAIFWRPNLLSLHSTKASILFRIIGYFLKVPTIVTVHGWSFSGGVSKFRKYFMILLERILSFAVSRYILVSKYDFDLALRERISDIRKLKIIYNGAVVPSQSRNSFRKESLIITMVARFDLQKDQMELLEACSDFENVTINFVGDGPTRLNVESCYKSGKYKCKVNFLGFKRDVLNVLLESDMFALISNWEGFPISTIEAMSIGLPVIVSNVGGAAECVSNGENGFVIEKGDLKSLRNVISQIILKPDVLPLMGNKSRKIFIEQFTLTKFYSNTLNFYMEVIN